MKRIINKILFVLPPGTSVVQSDGSKQCKECAPPIGVAYLVAQLRDRYEVRVYDMVVEGFWNEMVVEEDLVYYGVSYNDYEKVLKEFQPDLVGFQCMISARVPYVLKLCEMTKRFYPQTFTVLGAHHATALPDHVLGKDVDFVVQGEADHNLPALIESIDAGEQWTTVDGIVPFHYVHDIENLPLPAWNIVGLEKYWLGIPPMGIPLTHEKFGVVVSSRGCPHVCFYCGIPNHTGRRSYRTRSIDSVVVEISWLIEEYGVEEIQFMDDNFLGGGVGRASKLISNLYEKFPDLAFAIPTGLDLSILDKGLIELMGRAGFRWFTMGVETGNLDFQGRYVDKRIDLRTLKDKVDAIHSFGGKTIAFFLLGFPNETREQVDRTVEVVTSCGFDFIHLIMLAPIPGSGLYEYCVRNDLLYDDFDPTKIRYCTTYIKNPNMSREELEGIRKSVWTEYMSGRVDINKYNEKGWK